jgi:hypothetical protein
MGMHDPPPGLVPLATIDLPIRRRPVPPRGSSAAVCG